jgi:hypothetical protein
VREKRGPLSRTVGAVAGSLANAARRSQAAATTRVVVYDAAGHATLLRPDTPEHTAIAEPAERLIALVREARPGRRGGEPGDAGDSAEPS